MGGWYILRDGWNVADFDFKVLLRKLQVDYGANPFFKINVVPNPRSPGDSSIIILPSGLGLPDRNYYYTDENDKITTAYKQLIRDVVINLGSSQNDAQKFAQDLYFYEKRIAEVTPESIELTNPINTDNTIKISGLKISTANLPLQDILTAMYPTANLDEDTEIIVGNMEYLLKISQIISSTDSRTMNSYMIWTLVKEYLPYLSTQLTTALDSYHEHLYGKRKPMERWEFCTGLVQRFLPVAINVELEEKVPVSDGAKEIINKMFIKLKSVVKKHLNKYATVPELHSYLNKKLASLTVQIGLPNITTNLKEYYNKLIILKTNLFGSYKNAINFLKENDESNLMKKSLQNYILSESNKLPFDIQYLPSNNTIIIPKGILTAPYFEDAFPLPVIYSRLGIDLAKAIASSVLPHDSAWTGDKKLLTSFHSLVNESIRLVRFPTRCLSDKINEKKLAVAHESNITALNTFKYLSAVNIAHEALNLEVKMLQHVHQPSFEIYEDSALFYLTNIQSLCTLSTQQQDLYDNLVNFQLSENSLLQVLLTQDKNLHESLECKFIGTSQCSDIF